MLNIRPCFSSYFHNNDNQGWPKRSSDWATSKDDDDDDSSQNDVRSESLQLVSVNLKCFFCRVVGTVSYIIKKNSVNY